MSWHKVRISFNGSYVNGIEKIKYSLDGEEEIEEQMWIDDFPISEEKTLDFDVGSGPANGLYEVLKAGLMQIAERDEFR
ncbi:MAG: hypothetical protein ACTSRG_25115 [Candidatus Helarchaeota archaeon]